MANSQTRARRRIQIALMCLFPLAGCATQGPPVATQQNPNDGPGPYPVNYEEIVNNYLRENLKDPYSIRDLQIGIPQSRRVFVGLLNGTNLDAWQLCVAYNAKNSFGGYVGLRRYTFTMRDGKIASTPFGGILIAEGCSSS